MYARLNLRKNMELRARGPQTGREVCNNEDFQSRKQVAIAIHLSCSCSPLAKITNLTKTTAQKSVLFLIGSNVFHGYSERPIIRN